MSNQLCLRGHDTYTIGRFKNSQCKRCAYERNKRINEARRGIATRPRIPREKVVLSSEVRADRRLREKYGITLKDKHELLAKQGSVCANNACAAPLIISSACVDHCHRTGKVRGILCSLCNSAIGHAKESITVLQGCIAYLKNC